MRERLVKAAKERGWVLRQSYERLSKKGLYLQSRYRHARQTKRADKETKTLKNYRGRVIRNIQRLVS
jgi:IS5 family transposase